MKGVMTGGKKNHGVAKDGKFNTPYGKDDSDFVGSAAHERGGKMGGGVNNVSDSLNNK